MGLVFKRGRVFLLISEGSTEAQDPGKERNEEEVRRWPGSTSAHIFVSLSLSVCFFF